MAALASARATSSPASSASSQSATASSTLRDSRANEPSCASRPLFSLLSACAFFWSSQKPGWTLSRSIRSTRAFLRSTSKRPPQRGEALGEVL